MIIVNVTINLEDKIPPESPYSKFHFVQFLLKCQCMENLDFYMEITQFLGMYECHMSRGNGRSKDWSSMYRTYIEPEIVNLPGDLIAQTNSYSIPDKKVLTKIQRHLESYLHTSYYEFVTEISNQIDEDPISTTNDEATNTIPTISESPFTNTQYKDSTNMQFIPTETGRSMSSGNIFANSISLPKIPRRRSSHSLRKRNSSSSGTLVNASNGNANTSWAKFSRKFKWRRSSSTSSSSSGSR